MDIKSYFNILIKRLWMVILIPLLAAGVTAAISFYVLEPEYESSITLYVTNKDSDSRSYDDILTSQQLMKDCRELIKSKSITKAVIEQLNLTDLTEEELAKKITVNLKNDTRLFEIKVRDASNERAKDIVDAISTIFQKKVNELMKLQTFDVIDEAEIPLEPVSPKPLVNILIAFFVALFLAVCAAFIIEYLDDTLKDIDDIEKLLGVKVIGIIPSLDLR
jgi:capsular polysaccharide biosynthesis protein